MKLRTRLVLLAALVGLCHPDKASAQAPANNDFANAEVIPVATGTASGTNVAATAEAGEPPSHFTLTATGLSVWYSYTPTSNGMAYMNVGGTGVGTAAAAMFADVYTGASLVSLTRVAAANSTAGTATVAPIKYNSNLFQLTSGTTYYIQVTGTSNTATSTFDLAVLPAPLTGSVVLPPYSSWQWLHTLSGEDVSTDAAWAGTWKTTNNNTVYTVGASTFTFNAAAPGPLGFAQLDGAPGIKTAIGTPTSVAAGNLINNAAYFRTTFTLPTDTSNLWAEIIADDGAYIYIDGFAGIPVNIAAKLTTGSITTAPVFQDFRPQTDVLLTGTVPTAASATGVAGCRAYVPTLPTNWNAERSTRMVYISGLVGKLAAGSHNIAVSVHQTLATSSDDAFDLQLLNFTPRTLPPAGLGITFNDTPFVAQASGAVIAAEHQFAPSIGQTDLAWYCESPLTRGATALNSATVLNNEAFGGSQKALRLRRAETGRFVTEPISVDGLPQYTASIKILTHNSSAAPDTFETDDGFRVFLETSTDGINFTDAGLDVQPQINGATAYSSFADVYTTRSIFIPTNTNKAVRMVITGGTNSDNEYIYFDDVRFGTAQVFAVVSNQTYNNQGDDDTTNDTVSFDLTVTGSGVTGPGWTTSGFGVGSEVSGTFGGPAVTITRPATTALGARQNIAFSVVDNGDAINTTTVAVTTPAAVITAPTALSYTGITRNLGVSATDPSDDTYSFNITVLGTATAKDFEIRSNDASNTLYATGAYGSPTAVSIPVSLVDATFAIVDKGTPVPTVVKVAATLDRAGLKIAIGKTNFSGVIAPIYNDFAVFPAPSSWRQSFTFAADAALTVDAYTSTMNPGVAVTDPQAILATPDISLAGLSNVTVSATLRAFENSTTGFEPADIFKIEVITTVGGVPTTTNLIDGLQASTVADPVTFFIADANLDHQLNGNSTTYDANPGTDEFNLSRAVLTGNSSGTFNFSYSVPAGTDSVTVKITGKTDSPAEHFFIQNLVVAGTSGVAAGDTDGDGVSDADELTMGTNPNNALDVLRLTQSSTTPGRIDFPTVNGKFYRVYVSDDTDGNEATHLKVWKDLNQTTILGDGNPTFFNISVDPGEVRRFYRLRVQTVNTGWPLSTGP